jgi:dipeptidase
MKIQRIAMLRTLFLAILTIGWLGLLYVVPDRSDISDGSETSWSTAKACSSFAAGRLATDDGSVMAGHTLDGSYDFRLKLVSGGEYKGGDKVYIDYPGIEGGWKHTVRGRTEIPQVATTYAYFHADCPLANEHQVFFGENTCPTREELRTLNAEQALLDWTQVAALALQRGKTAREAIKAAGALIEAYGLTGEGESFLVTDPREAWCFEIPGFTREWVAQRIPDDEVCPHANRMRIGEVNLSDSERFMASPHLIKTAQDKGFYNPGRDGVFNFAKVYNDERSMQGAFNRRREWRMLSLLRPSASWDPDALMYPFSVKPEKKISAKWWLQTIWRDNLEGTPYDKTKGLAAGPFGSPERPAIGGSNYERSISIGEMSYSWVSQSRSWLPNGIGGVFWFGLDSSRSTCYTPFYVGISGVPQSYQRGDYLKLSDQSAFWAYQRLDTLSLTRYRDIHKDIRSTLDSIEEEAFGAQGSVEKKAAALFQINQQEARAFLTRYVADRAIRAEESARELFNVLSAKYRDGLPAATVEEDWRKILSQR